MENLKEINFREVTMEEVYVFQVTEDGMFGDICTNLLMGKGSEIVTFLRKDLGFEDDWSDEGILMWVDENGSDGGVYYSIFKV